MLEAYLVNVKTKINFYSLLIFLLYMLFFLPCTRATPKSPSESKWVDTFFIDGRLIILVQKYVSWSTSWTYKYLSLWSILNDLFFTENCKKYIVRANSVNLVSISSDFISLKCNNNDVSKTWLFQRKEQNVLPYFLSRRM